MRVENAGSTLPYRCGQVFDLLADIERYPQFLPGWSSAHISRRQGDTLYVEQVVGFGALRLPFSSVAQLHPPECIEIASQDRLFRRYALTWRIEPGAGGCRIGVTAEIELASWLLQLAVDRFLAGATDDIIAAFEARAHALYRSA